MTVQIDPYDAYPECDKCDGHEPGITTTYYAKGACVPAEFGSALVDLTQCEHLKRQCKSCGYWWREYCADYEEPTLEEELEAAERKITRSLGDFAASLYGALLTQPTCNWTEGPIQCTRGAEYVMYCRSVKNLPRYACEQHLHSLLYRLLHKYGSLEVEKLTEEVNDDC